MPSYRTITQRIAETLSVSMFAIILVLQVVNIFLRYTKVAAPLMWVEEFTRYAFIWIVFLVWHLSDREDSHFRADILSGMLGTGGRRYLSVLHHLMILGFGVLTIWSSITYIPATFSYATNSFAWLPMGVIYLVIPIGLFLVAIEHGLLLWKLAFSDRTCDP